MSDFWSRAAPLSWVEHGGDQRCDDGAAVLVAQAVLFFPKATHGNTCPGRSVSLARGCRWRDARRWRSA
jgi:hypothetical protein